MCDLQRIRIPDISPPHEGPWRIRETKTSGMTILAGTSYLRRVDADLDADRCNRLCREGSSYDVVPDPGGARFTFG